MRLPAFLALCLLLCPAAVAAQEYRIDAWTADDGLPQNPVNRVLQTRDGFLWLATFSGLARYDGARFEVFNAGTTPAIRASRFTNLFEDRDGNLWASTEGQGLVRYRDGVFQMVAAPEGLLDLAAQAFVLDPVAGLLLDTVNGVLRWTGARFERYTEPFPSAAVAGQRILTTTATGAVWYLDRGALHRFERGRITRTVPMADDVRWMFEDSRGRLWVEVAKGSERVLLRLENGAVRRFTAADGVPAFSTMAVKETADGTVWFGMRSGGGLLRYRNERFTRLTTADGLPNNNVGQVIQDREGSLWAPTEGGLARISPRVVSTYGRSHGLSADNIYALLEEPDGRILIGGWRGLTEYRSGVFTDVSAAYGLGDRNVMTLMRARDGELWIGMWGWGGLLRVHDGRISPYLAGSPAGDVVRAIHQHRSGDIWLGGNSGLTRYRAGTFTRITAADGFAARTVLGISETRDGALWIGTDEGVSRYLDGAFTTFSGPASVGPNVRAVHEDANGVMWFGTYDSGLYRFAGGRFTRFTTREGLFDNGIFRILEDGRGYFWLSSNLGISRVAHAELNAIADGRASRVTSVSYGRADGMATAESNGGSQPAGIRTTDGRLWFPTQQGVAVVDADRLPANALAPPVVITNVRVDQQAAPTGPSLTIRPGQGTFEIEYAGLTYIRPDLTRFRYRLEGIDPDWLDVGNRRTAYFSHVPPGHYTFVVSAANRDGVWNETGARMAVIIVPPFYRTWWFQGTAVLVLGGLAYGVHRRRIDTLERAQAVRDGHARQLIDAQERDRQRIAAEIHDSLSQNLVLIGNWARQAAHADIASTASAALSEVQSIAYNLGPFQLDRLGLRRTIEALLTRVERASSIRFVSTIGDIDGVLPRDQEIGVYRMIQESVNNILKHSQASEAVIKLSARESEFVIVIQDNGCGFQAIDPGATRPQGFGLLGLRERARMLGGVCEIDSTPGFGTRIDVTLPVTHS